MRTFHNAMCLATILAGLGAFGGCAGKNVSARNGERDDGTQGEDAQTLDRNQAGVTPNSVAGVKLLAATYENASHFCAKTTGASGAVIGIECHIQARENGVDLTAEVKGPGFDVSWRVLADKNGQAIAGMNPILGKAGLTAKYQFNKIDLANFDVSEIIVTAAFLDNIRALSRNSSIKVTARVCPAGYVSVPANPAVGVNSAFCAMKYEAKSGNGFAVSVPAGSPWEGLPRGSGPKTPGSAWKACADAGDGYDLISNAQWQAIARNIEGVLPNWSNGSTAGDNFINMGHSDNNPAVTLAASTDTDPCFGTGNATCTINSSSDFAQKRTHLLSNGEVIWDIAGNAYEWTRDTISQFPAGYYWVSQITEPSYDLAKFGPAGNYQDKPSEPYGGLGSGNYNTFAGPIHRGGGVNNGSLSGIFYASFDRSEVSAGAGYLGFRCVYK